MLGWSETANGLDERRHSHLGHQLLLIPEAPVLLALLLIGWAYHFPPGVAVLTALTIAVFLLRFCLLTASARQLERARYSRADGFSRAALRLYPWSADALTLRAQGLLLRGNDEAAEPLLRRAARLAPDSDLIHGALAGTLLARGEFAAGREHATLADRLAAGSPYAARHLAWLALHVDDDPIAAQRLLGAIDVEHTPPPLATPMLVMLAEAQIARGTVEIARETLRRIEDLLQACPIPQQAEFLYHLGKLHTELGDDASRHFYQSVKLDPHGRYAHAAWRAAAKREAAPRPLAAS